MPRRRRGRVLLAGASTIALFLGAGAVPASTPRPGPPLLSAGLVGVAGPGGGVLALPPAGAAGERYLGGSSVLERPDGHLLWGPPGFAPGSRGMVAGIPVEDAGEDYARRAAQESQRWLAAGLVPGTTAAEQDMAARALLDLRLLTLPSGAAVAAWRRAWRYVWPRDASWVAAAFAATGHRSEAASVLSFLASTQSRDGRWAARHHPGTALAVADGRERQLDSTGWFPWAVWCWASTAGASAPADQATLRALWPAVRRSADAAAAALRADGLPVPSGDYWELRTDEATVGTSAALLAGLRSAADLAARQGDGVAAQRWEAAARHLAGGVERAFAPLGYPRTPVASSGADSAVTWLAPPFAPYDEGVHRAVRRAAASLATPGGGMLPGAAWPGPRDVAWTPATASFALAAAASGAPGDRERADRWLAWLAEHRTVLGALPEKVAADGAPASVAPLGWTAAIVLLALVARDVGLPTPPSRLQ